ncbi:uveal autoantigen with coiled-coil domains and ankyrin repeats-like [Hibiscus syriacus]|uniref:uveal autoantigen with coiled-coil domains and ankyrin repeats-like n=1 Tax=Hibiscus syriacus TaxID=106335 RepID=UPI0019226A7C|nr:uveal autoantigen with coiled-coil domains and ankyrin repeats-like [Hibiscus syriacus]
MFKSVRWRGDKDRIKALFKLQFHATQVTETKLQALIISVIPDDGGKLIRTLEKATVQDGNCRWENPVYETVKFVREPRTGKISERIYHFVLSTGLGKGLVGEVSLDVAAYAEAIKTCTVSLPLKNSNSKAILHISIQRLHENADQREVEETEDASSKLQDRSLMAHLSNGDADESIKKDPVEDTSFGKTTHNVDLCGNHRGSGGSDITISSSNSSSGLNTPRELDMRNDSIKHEWSAGSDHGMSTDDSNTSQDTFPLENSQQGSDNEIERLKSELIVLSRQVDVTDLELQTLRKQIVKESKRGQDLSREVVNLKEERDALKLECEKLKASRKEKDDASVKGRLESGDPWVLVHEIREELKYEKDLNSNLRLQLQKTRESNAELLLAVQDLEEMFGAKNMEIPHPPKKSGSHGNAKELRETISRSDTYEDEDQRALEHLVHEHGGTKETSLLEQKLMNLCSELEICNRDKDELEAQMEQLALDYEILKQENHDISYKLEQTRLREQLKIQYECPSSSASLNELENQIECLQSELSKQSKELCDSLATINQLETHVRSLKEELEKQAQIFERDLESITQSKVEQEQRAIRAEEALRTTRLKNAKTAERLQEEFQRLSMQMASTFDAKEKVATSALAEASALHLQKYQLQEMLKKANEELESVREDYEGKLFNLSDLIKLKSNQIAQMLEEIDDKSKQLEDQKKLEGEVSQAFSEEICTLKAEINKLTTEKNHLYEQAEQAESLRLELEHTKTLVKDTEVQMQRGNLERNNLVSAIALMKKEATESQEKLQRMRHLKDEKEAAIESLQSELDTLKGQCDKLKHSLLEGDIEKEELRKQVVQLKTDLKKKEDAFTCMEKKLKGSNGRGVVSDGTRTPIRNNKSATVPCSPKEVASLRETIKLLEGQIKLKEAALETSTNVLLEKEKDLQNKIDELENRVEELNEQSSGFCNYQLQTVFNDTMQVTFETACISKENGNAVPFVKGTNDNLLVKERVASVVDKDDNQDEWRDELTSLKERNKSMENKLKDMQERYSEISLKFAEVEGERQKLVMTVRNLVNARKS